MQATVLITTLILIAFVAVVFAACVFAGASRSEQDKSTIERRRVQLMLACAAIGFIVTYVSLRPWPHDAEASEGAVTVDILGNQWSWEVSHKELPTKTPVVFNVRSNDVNHGVGIYDPNGVLLFQTQAMPGVTNRVRYEFAEPGTYRVMCMEYCGLAHHGMIDEITVVQK